MPNTEKIKVQPQEIQDVGTQNIDLQKITEASKKVTANAVAKALVLVSIIPAYASKVPEIMMQDQEALGFAIPSVTILFRYAWFQKFYKQYGHYLNNTDELYMLGLATYMYGSRVKMILDHKKERKKNEQVIERGIRTESSTESFTDGRFAGPIPTVGWRAD